MLDNIKNLFEAFIEEAKKGDAGNASAARRSRKISHEITKALKEYRQESIEKSKK